MPIALDATYSIGSALSGVGVYSNEILRGLARSHPEANFDCRYRPHRFLRSLREDLPRNCSRRILHEPFFLPSRCELFHGLNQRLPDARLHKTVTTFHDLFVLTGEYSSPEFRERFARQARHAAERSDRIIAVSQFTADQVTSLLGIEPARLRVVHHGVHRERFSTAREREKIVLHVGAIQRRKNIARLVRAFESLDSEWRLVLAGSAGFGSEEILAGIEQSAARSRIEVTGYLSQPQMDDLYARASIFAFPSLDEGFGIPLLEAMAAGVPIVCSDTSALPEVVGDAAIKIDPQREESIAEGLLRLAHSEDVRHTLTRRGQQRVQTFTWETAVEKTWKVYEELL